MAEDVTRDATATGPSLEDSLQDGISLGGNIVGDAAAASGAAPSEASDARVAEGGNPNIMPPQSSHTIACAPVNGGVDWLTVCLYGSWPEDAWHSIQPLFESAKQRAATSPNGDGEYIFAPTGDDMLVLPHSVRHGVICNWAFKWRGCQFALVRCRESTGYQPIIFITIPSRVLLAIDWWTA